MSLRAKQDRTEADRNYLEMALAERANSDDPKARYVQQSGVGAVIVGRDGVLARSANVLPPALKKHSAANGSFVSEIERYHFVEHAERAAIFKALLSGQTLDGGTIYCTRFPCSDCARAIVWSGISRVVLSAGFAGEARWLEAQRGALQVLRRSGVTVRVLTPSPAQPAVIDPIETVPKL